jgi:hypothetical protein
MEELFISDLQAFLKERIDSLDFSAVSFEYRKTAIEIERLYDSLKLLLSEDEQKKFRKLDDEHGNRLTVAVEIAYQKGFAEGVKLILHLHSIS